MAPIRRSDNINAVIIRGISFLLGFIGISVLIIGGIVASIREGDFITLLRPSVFVGAFSVLFVSSIIYTPFSYGISYYFLRSKSAKSRPSDILWLFSSPKLLLRAIICDSIRRIFIALIRLMVLLAAAIFELLLFIYFPPSRSVSLMLHIIAWSIILFLLFLAKIRFILCKYVLIVCPDCTIPEVFYRGLAAIRGHTPAVIRFYIKYLAVYIFTFLTLGLTRARHLHKSRDSFCTFAVKLVKNSL